MKDVIVTVNVQSVDTLGVDALSQPPHTPISVAPRRIHAHARGVSIPEDRPLVPRQAIANVPVLPIRVEAGTMACRPEPRAAGSASPSGPMLMASAFPAASRSVERPAIRAEDDQTSRAVPKDAGGTVLLERQ